MSNLPLLIHHILNFVQTLDQWNNGRNKTLEIVKINIISRKYLHCTCVDTHLVALVEAEHCALSSLERELAHVHVGPRGGAAAGLLVILSMGDHCEAGETLLSCVIVSYITRGSPPPLCTHTQQ